jgi:uncharacterized OB-fold protein
MTEPRGKFFMGVPEHAEPFFEAARENKLFLQRCLQCNDWQFYPRQVCTHCGSSDVEWAQASGRGTVHTFTVIHQQGMPGWRDEVPYVAAIIDLAEGPRMTSTIVETSPDRVTIGMDVEVVFVDEGIEAGQYVLPRWRPASGQ